MADEDLKRLLDTIRQENANAHTETRRHVDGSIAAVRQENASAHVETRRHFDAAVEGIERRFDGLADAVALVGEKMDRNTVELQDRMERGFADTQATIKFSHA